MQTNFSIDEFNLANSDDILPLICLKCESTFYKKKKYIAQTNLHKTHLKPCSKNCKQYANGCLYCSTKCSNLAKITQQKVNCAQCNIEFTKQLNQIKVTKNNFCSKSCAASYNNTHKIKGYRRSKLEFWLELQLPILHPKLYFEFNKKDAINSELDIYIPSLKLAFELNGIFHYEPIYGDNKLNQIKNNDNRKFQACLESNIELCIIDTSSFKHFKENKAKEFLTIISNIINLKQSRWGKSNPHECPVPKTGGIPISPHPEI